ncbi:MAG: hypothetical protein GY725_02430 [bacterium]|nr:hypothetical protein [bacterium]
MLEFDKWKRVEDRNILALESVTRLHNVLDPTEPRNMIFGFHYYYRGGQGCTNVASRSPDEVLQEVEASMSGDHFTLYSLAEVAHLAEMKVPVRRSDPHSAKELVAAVRKRSRETELVIVFDIANPEIDVVYDIDDREASECYLEWLPWSGGDVYVFRMDVLDEGRDGSVVSSVSPPSDSPRVHALLDAKRPSPDGRTPSSGSY